MTRSSKGLSVLELVVAFVLIAGPLAQIFGLVQSNARASRSNDEHMALTGLVSMLLERLAATPAADIDHIPAGEESVFLSQLVEKYVAQLPAELGTLYRKRFARQVATMELGIQRNGGNHPGLYVFTIAVHARSGRVIKGARVAQL
jgi:hypothetical protein